MSADIAGGAGDRRHEREQLLDELAAMRLREDGWARIEAQLHLLHADDVDGIAQVVFEARIQRRFRGGRATSTLPPTKQTSALPWVGVVCGGLLLAVGGALGGGPVLVGVGLLGLFVFGIAMAGSRVAHARPRAQRHSSLGEPGPPPASVVDAIDALRAV